MLKRLKEAAKKLKREIVPIYYALFDKRTPLLAKILALITVGYLLSPIDLIPDFIPVLGILDDLLLVPLLITITLKLIPREIIEEIRKRKDLDISLKKRWYLAIPIVLLYGLLVYWIIIYFHKKGVVN